MDVKPFVSQNVNYDHNVALSVPVCLIITSLFVSWFYEGFIWPECFVVVAGEELGERVEENVGQRDLFMYSR